MPLQALDAQSYIRRTRLLVNSDQRATSSNSQFDFVFELPSPFEKVIGLEMVGYNMKRDVQQTFYPDQGFFKGNLFIDVYMDRANALDTPYYFTIELAPRDYTDLADLQADLQAALNDTMDAGGHPTFNTGFISWTVTSATTRGVTMIYYELNNSSYFGQFLFGSGPNAHRSAAKVLGFVEGVDSNAYVEYDAGLFGTGFYNTPQTTSFVALAPWRYIDVHIDEFPELKPVARIPFFDATTTLYERSDASAPRLLEQPVKRLDSMRFRLTLPDGRPPLERSLGGYDLVFDVLTLSPETGIPAWVQQKLVY